MEDKKFAENEEQHLDSTVDVTELDDEALEDASGGLSQQQSLNTNCGVC